MELIDALRHLQQRYRFRQLRNTPSFFHHLRLASSLSEEFSIEIGVKQGCVIASYLFNCVIDHLTRRLLSRCNLGIQLGEYQLTDLDYADDIAIFAPSACVLQEALTILQEEAKLVEIQNYILLASSCK